LFPFPGAILPASQYRTGTVVAVAGGLRLHDLTMARDPCPRAWRVGGEPIANYRRV
jgi:hypothetical protein